MLASLAYCQPARPAGSLEGILTSDTGDVVYEKPAGKGAVVVLKPKHGKELSGRSDLSMRGHYSIQNVPPGIYELFVRHAYAQVNGQWVQYRPRHVYGVKIRPKRRAKLFITLNPGSKVEEIGKPRL
jgi:hypothetical protein